MAKKLSGFVFRVNSSTIEVKLTNRCIEECSHQGSCDEDVECWVTQLRPYLDGLPGALVAACLRGYGAWDEEELKDHEQNLRRFLWCAASSAKEDKSCWATMDSY